MLSDTHEFREGLPVFAEHFPEVAQEVADLLLKANEPNLASQIPQLRVWDRCRCGDSFCSTIYIRPKPKGTYPANCRTVDLDASNGMNIVDIVGEEVACIEILHRDKTRERLLRLLP
jgi:hypothetical protein